MQHIRAILFDKDGTLFDFQATWGAWAQSLLAELSRGDAVRVAAMANAIGFDWVHGRFRPESPVIAGTGHEAALLLEPHVPDMDLAMLEMRLEQAAAGAPLRQAVPLRPLLERLRGAGYRLGVATNDFESVAREHVADVVELFDFIAGFDSGHGGKPEPGMLLAFARACGLAPETVLMVGDSRHDLIAGRAAGMSTLAVLTGVARAEDLEDLADAVCPDIGSLPGLLGL